MEKRIAVIIRWLERCLEAHRAGEMESALMDVECARADMDLLRDGFWSKLDRRRAARKRRAFAAAFFETALGAALMILATAAPLALPPETRYEEIAVSSEPAVFAEEKAPPAVSEPETPPVRAAHAGAKRAEPKAELPRAQPLEMRPFEAQPLETQPLEARPFEARPLEAQPFEAARRSEKREMTLSYENILALVQTGEKALKNEKPAIEIERRDRRGF